MSLPPPKFRCLGLPRDISSTAVEAQNDSAKMGCDGIQIPTEFSAHRSILRMLNNTPSSKNSITIECFCLIARILEQTAQRWSAEVMEKSESFLHRC
jgi:hypothetical protein